MINKLKRFLWSKKILRNRLFKFRKFLGPTRIGRFLRKLLLPPEYCYFHDFFNFYMNAEYANFIIYNTIKKRHTARALARVFKEEFPETDIIPNDQMDGMGLRNYVEFTG